MGGGGPGPTMAMAIILAHNGVSQMKIFRPVLAREPCGPGFSGPARAGPLAARPVPISSEYAVFSIGGAIE